MSDIQPDGAPSSSEPVPQDASIPAEVLDQSGVDAAAGGDAGSAAGGELPNLSGTDLSSSTASLVPAEAGNVDGRAEASADTATSTSDALADVGAEIAAATFVDLSTNFETRQYPDGTTLKSQGALPEQSPVSYPAPTAPAVDTPHGLLNAIEEFFTTALRSSRTDGHKLIAQLRAQLPQ